MLLILFKSTNQFSVWVGFYLFSRTELISSVYLGTGAPWQRESTPKNETIRHILLADYTKVYPCLRKVNHNDSLARCTNCNSDFSIAHGGLNYCKRHVEDVNMSFNMLTSSTSFISCAY